MTVLSKTCALEIDHVYILTCCGVVQGVFKIEHVHVFVNCNILRYFRLAWGGGGGGGTNM